MIIKAHGKEAKTAEVISDEILINNVDEALQLLADLYYQGFEKIVIHEKNVIPDFFELKNGLAGEILQKFSNYRMQLIIIGEFNKFSAQSIKDFIYESNKGKQVNFLSSFDENLTN